MIYAIHKITKEHRQIDWGDEGADHEWRCALADADGWIPWEGGECPLPDDCGAEVKTNIGITNAGRADEFRWARQSRHGDIIAYRPILDSAEPPQLPGFRCVLMPDVSEAPVWDGDGLPPVGVECEVMHCEVWKRCEIIAHFKQGLGTVAAFTVDAGDGIKALDAYVSDCFRTIRSAEDQAVEEMVPILRDATKQLGSPKAKAAARALYAAIRDGKIPGVKLED